MSINSKIIAPIPIGTALGTVLVKLGDVVVTEQALVNLNAVNEGSFWQRITDEALLYFE